MFSGSLFESRVSRRAPDCVPADPANTVADRINTLLNSSGPGYILSLCPKTQYLLQAPILFAAPRQEISTAGYPTNGDRAMLVVAGPVANGVGHTTAVDGTCATCSGIKLRNIQINGTRGGFGPTGGGANIEMGGSNSDQLIEYVHSFDPRSWSCLHIAEGPLNCNNVTVQNNDIGPCGSDNFQEWADGISMSCRNSVVRNNMINNPTDGGVVLFGAPGTLVENNTIWVEKQVLLGGINLVDYDPFSGDYTGTIVRNNTILGGFSTEKPEGTESKGENADDVVIKIGIAIGPKTWFGVRYGNNVSHSGTVINNRLSGAFSYAIAVNSARNFTVQNNVLFGNTSFIGSRGVNCSDSDIVPTPQPFVFQANDTLGSNIQGDFQAIPDADSLTCVKPPDDGDYWPFGGNPANPTPGEPTASQTPGAGQSSDSSGGGGKGGLIAGVVVGVLAFLVALFFLRKWYLQRVESKKLYDSSRAGYVQSKEEQ